MRALILSLLFAATASGGVRYPIVDTGQTAAYGPYAGQDAHYLGNAPAYRDHGDGTVTDRVTGLMWTRDPGEKMTHAEALRSAKTCRVGGHADWRLPTIKELYSLISFNGVDPDPRSTQTGNLVPFIDASVFAFRYGDPDHGERIIDAQFATSTLYVSTTMGGNKTMFGVNFADGRIKGYPVVSRRGEKTFHVLYVRGNPGYGHNAFKENGDGTITDEATGLTWMKADSGEGMNWPAALAYAEGMEFAGRSDWRLPTAKELQSIIDYTRSPDTTGSAAIDPIFETTEIENEVGNRDFAHYWTSTTHVGARGSDTAAYFAFGRSLGWMEDRRTGEKNLLDVHGAGSQRSDPKTGDAARFPFGRGPQGDVIRIENMVRLVRGGNVDPVAPVVSAGNAERGKGPPAESSTRLLRRFDQDNDGQVTRAEFKGPDRRFHHVDTNRDGVISAAEAEAASPPPGRMSSRPGRGGDPRPFEQAAVAPTKTDGEPRPNIVFILADDMGWTGTSVEMIPGDPATRSDYYQTPNLEKLAAQGMRFSQAYSPAALCTPARAAILTGKTPAELRITSPGRGLGQGHEKLVPPRQRNDIPAEEVTIAEALQGAGYLTAHLGKWHIGRGGPGEHGFAVHDGATGNDTHGSEEDPKEIFSLTDRAIDFIRQAKADGLPFYLHLSHYAVHSPVETRATSAAKFGDAPRGQRHTDPVYAGMTWDLDSSVGTLLAAMYELDLAATTYVVFMSDNGASGGSRNPRNDPLKRGKGTLYEGGIRVPLIIRGPGIRANESSSVPVTGCDLFPTVAEWAGISSTNVDGASLGALLTGERNGIDRAKPLLFHYPHYGAGPSQRPQSALIAGDIKLVRDWDAGSHELFDLSKDIGERTDLSASQPEKLKEMIALVEERLTAVDAQRPVPNPEYDPTVVPQRRNRASGKRG